MRYPQLLIYESDRRLAEIFRRAEEPRKWSLREPRSLESCLRLLRRGGPCVLVLKLGKDLVREMTLLERVNWLFPEAAIVVLGDTANPALADLAWELGATYVQLPLPPRHELVAIVSTLLQTAEIARPILLSPLHEADPSGDADA